MIILFLFGANPAIRYNIFFFKEKKKMISTTIGARANFLLRILFFKT